jgi:putative transposase
VVKPVVRREVAGHLQKAYGISERRACSATGFQRSSQRYRKRSDPQVELRMRLKELAAARVRYGYRRLHIRLRREGWPVNHKRTYRLYREEGLSIRPKAPSASGPGVIGRVDRRSVDPTRCGRWTSWLTSFSTGVHSAS